MFRSLEAMNAFSASRLEKQLQHARKAIMATGTVKFFNTQKGFGFITPSDGSRDVFVHISAVERAGMTTLNEGQRLSYEIVTERGKQAASNLQNA
jgi:CspA family cold shock protein